MKKFNYKNGFTMIELVLVITVLGILAFSAMSRMERDLVQEAGDTILSDIRYTQHMAINDYRENPMNNNWQKSFWQIKIESCGSGSGLFISIGADKDYGGDIDKKESALDPENSKPMFWTNTQECTDGGDGTVSNNIFITKKFGVDSIETSGGCQDKKYIGFDHLGRPHVGFTNSATPDYSSYMQQPCDMKFTIKNGKNFTIRILPETGYAYIDGQPNS